MKGIDAKPIPGDLILTQIRGWVGLLVRLLQLINRDASRWTHVMVMLDDDEVFEAQPGGAVITPFKEYHDRKVAIVQKYQLNGSKAPLVPEPLTYERRQRIVKIARGYEGTGYGWGTYLYLALYRIGIRPLWLKRRVQDDDRLICSQAGDLFYGQAGVLLFDDGRMPYDVTPGDLARLL